MKLQRQFQHLKSNMPVGAFECGGISRGATEGSAGFQE
jgi:hypothetical protein